VQDEVVYKDGKNDGEVLELNYEANFLNLQGSKGKLSECSMERYCAKTPQVLVG